jgi:hypothetical protein
MALDNRKKKEELKEVVEEALQEEIVEQPQEEPQVENLEETPVEEPVEEVVQEVVEELPEVVEQPVDYEDSYERRYKESTKEAMTLYSKNKRIVEKIDEANALPEPTEEELVSYARKTGTNYDDLDDFTKQVLKETVHNKMKFEKINDLVKETREMDVWADKIDNFIGSVDMNTKYPLIDDNADKFRKFCLEKEHRGADIGMLASAFLYEMSITPAKKPSKGSMLLTGGSSGRGDNKPAGLTEEDAKNIRASDPKEYKRLIKAGKIKIEI